jgi:hypothetical protein
MPDIQSLLLLHWVLFLKCRLFRPCLLSLELSSPRHVIETPEIKIEWYISLPDFQLH